MSPLSPEQWKVLSPYLDKALTLSEEECAQWLQSLRVDNAEIAAQVEELLHSRKAIERDRYLEKPLPLGQAGAGMAGQIIGAYRLASPIGHGGMGTVWLAERNDGRFERKVAVKFPLISVHGYGAGRFKRE